ncbi:hypothetical protein [Solimonas marina]|uniref:Uncharacterized protein n=1 Tax=Solimonas marina TaxID=2714601 RepID=A0A969WDY0_9GAMM|nr:hypothetical protein [Solimonas marina]NKF24794.1 hypothetical protein [Solimonas marina]
MQRVLQTEKLLISTINVAIANDWKYKDHHCVVSSLRRANGPGCNWQVDIRNCGGSSLEHQEECNFLIERAVSVLAAKYNVAWPE